MTRGCRMHAATTTMIAAAIAARVSIVDLRNSTMQQQYSTAIAAI